MRILMVAQVISHQQPLAIKYEIIYETSLHYVSSIDIPIFWHDNSAKDVPADSGRCSSFANIERPCQGCAAGWQNPSFVAFLKFTEAHGQYMLSQRVRGLCLF